MIFAYRNTTFKYSIFIILITGLNNYFISCESSNSAPSGNYTKADLEEGKSLAQKYCQSCHLFPEASLADKHSWETGILPNMGPRLGIFSFNGKNYPSSRFDPNIGKSFYPDGPVLNQDEWSKIIAYYSQAAPDSLSDTASRERDSISIFQVESPKNRYRNPVSTYVHIDTTVSPARILVADGQLKFVYSYNNKLQLMDSFKAGGTIVDIIPEKNKMVLCNIGVINPNDGRSGNIEEIPTSKTGFPVSYDPKHSKPEVQPSHLFDSLRRPVQIQSVDLNADGENDYLICEFGNLLGALSWLQNNGDGTFTRHVIRYVPGAIHAVVKDYNHDGLPDIWVLFAQGDEGIVLFTNLGNGTFEERQILRFPAIYGSTYFELDDFNGDGYPDILYSCGDNADYSRILKPYHGVYIFLNDGKQHFTQSYFYPIHGCYKAMARDFDGDGDLDIAAISFFADYSFDPEEGFVYLENKGNLNFKAITVPETKTGRWLTMDVGDVNGDGKPDILLGNFSVGPTIIKTNFDWKNGPPFLLLKNTGKKKN